MFQEVLAHKYIDQMEEVKRRTDFILTMTKTGRQQGFPLIGMTECVYLQLRKILELIALASLAANREAFAKTDRTIGKLWHGAAILDAVARVNPNGYPHPIIEEPSDEPGVKNNLVDRTDGFLSKERFIELYGRCGSILHASNPFGRKLNYKKVWDEHRKWNEEIIGLLQCHKIQIAGEDDFWLVHMNEAKDNRVHLYQFVRLR